MKAFLLGILEFRDSVTTNFEGKELESYDKGRELAHKLTLRKWDDCH